MKKSIFAVMAFVLVSLLASCTKESKSEINVSVNDVTDSTAAVKCEYMPMKSVRYKLAIENQSVLCEQSKSFTLNHLAPGHKYSVVVTALDADYKEVENKVVEFMTTGAPDNYWQYVDYGQYIISHGESSASEESDSTVYIDDVKIESIADQVPYEIVLTTSYIGSNGSYSITVKGIDDDYNETYTLTATPGKSNISYFSCLTCGNSYDIYTSNGSKLTSFVKSH